MNKNTQLGSLAKKFNGKSFEQRSMESSGIAYVTLTKNNKSRLKWIEKNLYQGWASKSYQKQLNKIMNEALNMLYQEMLSQTNQGEDHEGIDPKDWTKQIGGYKI